MTLVGALFSFRGRMRRSGYWLASVGLAVARIVLLIVALAITHARMDDPTGTTVRLVLDALFVWPSAAIVIKRGHDRDRPTLYSTILVVIVCGLGTAFGYLMDAGQNSPGAVCALVILACWIYMFIDYGLIDGTKGPNRHGPSPKGIGVGGAELAKVFD